MKPIRPEDVTPELLRNLKYMQLTPEEVDEVLRLARAKFTAAEIQHYLEEEGECFPAEVVLRELEEAQRRADEGTE